MKRRISEGPCVSSKNKQVILESSFRPAPVPSIVNSLLRCCCDLTSVIANGGSKPRSRSLAVP